MKIKEAIDTLVSELSKDKSEGSYYYSWQANIAVAFQDEYDKMTETVVVRRSHIHELSNRAAKRFLDLLCHKPEPTTEKSLQELKH